MEFDGITDLKRLLGIDLPSLFSGRSPVKAAEGEFTFGIEEEYFLVDSTTFDVAQDSASFFESAQAELGSKIGREFLQPQVEVATAPHSHTKCVRSELLALRRSVGAAAHERGLAIMAAGTHPTARWQEVGQTPKRRYSAVMDGLQMIGQRNMLCGMHVHVQLPDPDRRVDVMSRMLPYVPLFLALSTSSPFWQSRRTGLKGYRLAAYDELPRTGLPELFKTTAEYDAYIAAMVASGAMEDSSYVWWTIRPSAKYPTLELRAPDCCTRAEDAVAIAALYRVLVRNLYFDPEHNCEMDAVARAISVENKWRAQRYGIESTFVTDDGAVTVADMLERVAERCAADISALDCAAEIAHCRSIVSAGTSADAQLAIFDASASEDPEAALYAVNSWIASATLQ